jgi:dCTP deaminase
MMLNDEQLKIALRRDPPLVSNFPEPWRGLDSNNAQWDSAGSPVQAASIDLHVGEIFVPETAHGMVGSVGHGATALSLPSGHSVVVQSMEELALPRDIAAIALPPSRVSSRGIFVSNFGHVDPGYRGRMRFTIINMGKNDFSVRRGDDVMTILFFKCEAAGADWRSRNPQDRIVSQQEVDYLARDFADFDARVDRQVKAAIGQSGVRYLVMTWFLPAIIGAALSGFLYVVSVHLFFRDRVENLTVLSNKVDGANSLLQDRMNRLEKLRDDFDASRDRSFETLALRVGEIERKLDKAQPSQKP